MNPMLLTDFYKVGHPFQYPPDTEYVYSNFTPRKSRMKGVDKMIFFGLQYFNKLILGHAFERLFFDRRRSDVIDEYRRIIRGTLGGDLKSYSHIEDLHELGYLPVRIKALPEGTAVPMRVPCITIENTRPEFYWITNFLETILSSFIWQPCTSATIAHEFRYMLDRHARVTGMPEEFVQWQGHDFSMRGMSSLQSAIASGMGHLLSFTGTDTIPAVLALEDHYFANVDEELVGGSVPATEHSVMCAGLKEGEIETFLRLMDTYPTGILSVVSDTWDLWNVLTDILPKLKGPIMAREGKLVIRPDSGDPANILCGDSGAPEGSPARKGVVELLWDVFGGTVNDKGYRVLDSHVGAIYGDGITIERAAMINTRLANKGFASQVVFGIGSYTYQANTRDTFGTAMKATWVQRDQEGYPIFKDPVTDDGTKRSATGLLQVYRDEAGELQVKQDCTREEEEIGLLQTYFENGSFFSKQTLADIRQRLKEERERRLAK